MAGFKDLVLSFLVSPYLPLLLASNVALAAPVQLVARLSQNQTSSALFSPSTNAKLTPGQATFGVTSNKSSSSSSSSCFPALGFKMPSSPPSSLDDWWCNANDEYAFMGFSYEVTACQSKSQLLKEFKDMRNTFDSRYVRLYGVCDNKGFYDDIVDAAWESGLGVHALIWFGFDGDDKWEGRRDALFSSLKSNPKAKYVTRVVQFGSEPLYDDAIPHDQLAKQVLAAKATLKELKVPVTVSEMAYGFQEKGGAQDVLDAVDSVNIHILPFFSQSATTGANAWPLVEKDLRWVQTHAKGKKLYLDENGWPSQESQGVKANSKSAKADVKNEQDYFDLLDSKCLYFKSQPNGGVGWFAHIYSDSQEPGYGVYDTAGKLKFKFKPRTSC